MFARLHAALFLLALSLNLAPFVDAAASLTPPIESTTGSIGLSLSFTPSSTSGVAGTGSSTASASGTGTATSSAQFPSLTGLSTCASQCFGLAISQDGCDSIVDVNCYCTNTTRFTSGLVACISTQCPNDLSSAESIAQQFCAVASQSTSLSFPTAPPSTTFSDPFTSSTSATSPISRNSSSVSSPSASSTASTLAAPTSSTGSGPGNGAGNKREPGLAGLLGLVGCFAAVLVS